MNWMRVVEVSSFHADVRRYGFATAAAHAMADQRLPQRPIIQTIQVF